MIAAITWDNLDSLPFAFIAMAVGLVLLVWLYRPQVRLAGPLIRWMLPLLRGAAIVALLASILKPVLATTASQAQRGAVVMIVDASLSMGVTDPRTPADRVALARALGHLPTAVTDEALTNAATRIANVTAALDRWQRAQDEARFAAAAGRQTGDMQGRVDAALEEVRDTTAALPSVDDLKDFPDVATAVRRVAQAQPSEIRQRVVHALEEVSRARAKHDAALSQSDSNTKLAADSLAGQSRIELAAASMSQVIAGLPPDVPVFAFSGSNDVTSLTMRAGDLPVINATGLRSDLPNTIDTVLERLNGIDVRAVLVWTDGRQAAADTEKSRRIMVPVLPIDVAQPSVARDVAVSITSVPEQVFLGETAMVQVSVRAQGFAVETVQNVELRAGAAVQSQSTVPDREGRATVEFIIKLDRAGVADLTASVAPQQGELTTENNVSIRRLRVLTDKLKVAAYAGSPTWDFQYLRNALQRSKWVELKEAIIGAEGIKFPVTPSEILQQNLIVLSDIDASVLDAAQWDAISQLVTVRGGSVIVLANDERTLAGYALQPQAANLLPLRSGLRYAWRTWSGERPTLRVVPSPDAAANVLRLDDDEAASRRRWQELPALFRVMPLTGLKPNVSPLLIEAESRAPVVTESRLGAGRAIFVGLNETWRWRTKVGERDQDRFLLQLVRHAADEPYAARDGGSALDADLVTTKPGGSVRLRASVTTTDGTPSSAATVVVTATRDGQAAREVVLGAVAPVGSGRFEGTVDDLAAGNYSFTLADPAASGRPAVSVVVEPDRTPELADVSADPKFLQRWADSTGGSYRTIQNTADLPAVLATMGTGGSSIVERPLWDSPQLFIFVLACLGTEWALRKQAGLA